MMIKWTRKNFTTKIKSTVKPIQKEIKIEETFDNIPQNHKKEFYDSLKYSIMVLDYPVKLRYWLIGHGIPIILTSYDPLSILWLYQSLWSSAAIGLATHSYEFYFNSQERVLLKLVIILGYI
jgi:hypothetical protein